MEPVGIYREQDIDDNQVPGSVQLIDLDHSIRTRHASGIKQDVVLIPTPSSDPDDPLNWSPRRKALSTFCWILYTWFTGLASSAVYSVLVPLSANLDVPVSTLNQGTGYLFLLAGWGLLFWQPAAYQWGKRPVYLTSTLGVLAVTFWSPFARGNGQWIAKNIIGGFMNAPIEALPELSVTDVYFAHERGFYMALYALVIVASNFFAQVICGWINVGQNFQWVFYWPGIFLACTFVFLFFFMEETNYDRKTINILESTASPAPSLDPNNHPSLEKSSPPPTSSTPAAPPPTPKSYLRKLALCSPTTLRATPNLFLHRILLQLRYLSWPIVLYSGFAYGSTLIWFNVLNATASLVLSAPPYSFSSGLVGTSYISCLIGVGLAFLFLGRTSDALVLRLSRRDAAHGVMQPEFRLWLFLVPTLVVPLGLILWGVGAAHHVHWFGLIVAMAVLAFVNTCGCMLGVTYLVDSYREIAGDAMASLIFVRNTMSFAIGYGVTPWVENMGLQNAFITAAVIGLVCCASFLVMIRWGKWFRERSRRAYWEIVRENIRKGALR